MFVAFRDVGVDACGVDRPRGFPSFGFAGFILDLAFEDLKMTCHIGQKMPDLNCTTIEAAMRQVEGTARNMGIEVK